MIEYTIARNESRRGTDCHFFIPDHLHAQLRLDELDRCALGTPEKDVADILQNLQILAFRARQQGLLNENSD